MLPVSTSSSSDAVSPSPSPATHSSKGKRPTVSHHHSRLLRDLNELATHPYPGVDVHFDDADVRRLCVHLTPLQGQLEGLRLHLSVLVHDDFPLRPPSAHISTFVSHPNVWEPGPSGYRICADILRRDDESTAFRDPTYTGGFTPAYSLQGIFIQLASFFSDSRVEQTGGFVTDLDQRDRVAELFGDDSDSDDSFDLPPPLPLEPTNPSRYIPGLTSRPQVIVPQPPPSIPKRYLLALRSALHFTCPRCGYGVSIPRTLPGAYSEHAPNANVPNGTHPCSISPTHAHRKGKKSISKSFDDPQSPSSRHGTDDEPFSCNGVIHTEPKSSLDDKCYISRLNADCFLCILDYLSTPDVLLFARAFPPVAAIIKASNLIPRREIRCFVLKKAAAETLLGVGIAWDPTTKQFDSPFDVLSIEAFEELNVRHGVRREPFNYWMPLAINAYHYAKAEEEVKKRLSILEGVLRKSSSSRRRAQSPCGYRVLCTIANDIVVRLMEECDLSRHSDGSIRTTSLLHTSERALTEYFGLLHLLISLASANPEIVETAETKLRNFINDPQQRIKSATPSLGELIVSLAIAPSIAWQDLLHPLIEESLTRNVVWALDAEQGDGKAGLALLETDAVSEYRLSVTFRASRTSLRLLMFQHMMMDRLSSLRPQGLARHETLQGLKSAIDANYGLPPLSLPAELVKAVKEIYAVSNFATFGRKLGLPAITKASMTRYLRERVVQSQREKYHVCRLSTVELSRIRASEDPVYAAQFPRAGPRKPEDGLTSFFLRPSSASGSGSSTRRKLDVGGESGSATPIRQHRRNGLSPNLGSTFGSSPKETSTPFSFATSLPSPGPIAGRGHRDGFHLATPTATPLGTQLLFLPPTEPLFGLNQGAAALSPHSPTSTSQQTHQSIPHHHHHHHNHHHRHQQQPQQTQQTQQPPFHYPMQSFASMHLNGTNGTGMGNRPAQNPHSAFPRGRGGRGRGAGRGRGRGGVQSHTGSQP